MHSRFDGGPIGDWKQPWLIQRLNHPVYLPEGHPLKGKDNPFRFGCGGGRLSKEALDMLRPIFEFDYMGSAEFEFGSVPKALQSMIASVQELCAVSFEIDQGDVYFGSWDERYFKEPVKGVKKTVHLIAKLSHHEPAEKYMRSMLQKDVPRLKEHSRFKEAFLDRKSPKEDWLQRTQGWFDIDNCLFFFTDMKMFEQMKALFFEAPKEAKA